jgi:hypothetical protein
MKLNLEDNLALGPSLELLCGHIFLDVELLLLQEQNVGKTIGKLYFFAP